MPNILQGILPLIALVIIVAVVVVLLVRRSRGGKEATGAGLVRRLYYYGISFIALMVAASGVTLLLSNSLAPGLALTIVGTPFWLFQWSFAQRAARRSPSEAQSLVRKAYLYMVLAVSLGVGMVGLIMLLQWALSGEDFRGSIVALPLVWGAVWGFHWRLESTEGQGTDEARSIRRLYVYAASVAGLAMLCAGLWMVLQSLLREAYNALFVTPRPPSELWGRPTQETLAVGIVGGVVWGWHWLWTARRDAGSPLRRAYFYLYAIPGGAATMLGGSIAILAYSFQWLLGSPDLPNPSAHFDPFPTLIAALTVGALVWTSHWRTAQREARATLEQPSSRRWYRYLMSALGLGASAAGLVFLLAMLLELAVPQAREVSASAGWWRNMLGLSLALLVVGVPLWGFYWRAVQRDVTGGVEERRAISRRVFVYLVFAVAVLMALGNFSAVLYQVFQKALDQTLAADVLRNVKWSLGMLVAAGAGSAYYWRVLQDDRRALAAVEAAEPARPITKRVTVLVSTQALSVARRLEALLGYPVSVWTRPDEDDGAMALTNEQLQAAAAAISAAPTAQVLVVVDAGGVRVLPYEENEAA